MAEKTLNVRIKLKRDTKAHWDSASGFSPKAGEPVVYTDGLGSSNVPLLKIGDENTAVTSLPFVGCRWQDVLGKPTSASGYGAASSEHTGEVASSSQLGHVKLVSDTVQTVSANAVSTTSGRTYAIQKNSSGQLVVNVPWVNTDSDTTYSKATSAMLGLIRIGYTKSGKNYPVELDTNGRAYVNVPWTDTDTTYSHPTSSGYKHIPSGGSSGQILKWSSNGTATWSTLSIPIFTPSDSASVTSGGGISAEMYEQLFNPYACTVGDTGHIGYCDSFTWVGSPGSYSCTISGSTHNRAMTANNFGTGIKVPRVKTYSLVSGDVFEEVYDSASIDISTGDVTVYSSTNSPVYLVVIY